LQFSQSDKLFIGLSIANWAIFPITYSLNFRSSGLLAVITLISGALLVLFYKYVYWWLFGIVLLAFLKKSVVSHIIAILSVISFAVYTIWGYPIMSDSYRGFLEFRI
jgi:hypothetical protein